MRAGRVGRSMLGSFNGASLLPTPFSYDLTDWIFALSDVA